MCGVETPGFSQGEEAPLSFPLLAVCDRLYLDEQNTHPYYLYQAGC